MIISPPEKEFHIPNPEVVFDLSTDLLAKLQSKCSTITSDLVLESNGTVVH